MKHTILRMLCLVCTLLLLGALCLTGCSSETPATEGDTHAGHDHGTESTQGTNAPVVPKHNHEEAAAMRLIYEEEEGGTLTLIVKDCQGQEVFKKTGLTKKSNANDVTPYVVELYWVNNSNPGGYECLYINRQTCQVSDIIVGEQITDGNRIVYTEVKNGKLNVIVRDLFDKNGYNKVSEIEGAYTGGAYTVLRAVRVKDQVNVSYLTDKDGAHRIAAFDLYEKGEQKPEATQKTAAKK